MADTILSKYLGLGLFAGRPVTPNPAPGTMSIYAATDTNSLTYWNGTAWIAGSVGPTGLTGGAGATGATGATGVAGGAGPAGAPGGTGPAGPTGSQGPAGTPGINGAVGSSSGYALLSSAAAGSTINAGITRVRSSGYSVAGIGGADYIYDAAVTGTTVTANPRTQFLAADTRGFKLDPTQRLTIEMFGGFADSTNGTDGTDNTPAILAAQGFIQFAGYGNSFVLTVPVWKFGATINFGVGGYRFSALYEMRERLALIGQNQMGLSSGGTAGPTIWYYPTNSGAIIFQDRKTSGRGGAFGVTELGSSSGSLVQGFSFVGIGVANDLTQHCVQWRTTATTRHNGYFNVAGNAEHIVGYTDGSAGQPWGVINGWVSEDNYCHDAIGHGQYIRGSDVNSGRSIGFNTSQCGNCGIYNRSYFSNYFQPADLAGYGNAGGSNAGIGVFYAGAQYQLSSDNNDGGTTTPGTNERIWTFIQVLGAANTSAPLWVNGNTYTLRLPFFDAGSGSVWDATYVETGQTRPVVHSPSVVIGGTTPVIGASLAGNQTTAGDALSANSGIGGQTNFPVGSPGYLLHGDYASELIGTRGYSNEYYHREYRNVANGGTGSWYESFVNGNKIHYYSNTNQTIEFHSGAASGPATTGAGAFGTGARVPYIRAFPSMGLGSGSYFTEHRILQYGTAAPTTGAHGQGEIAFNIAPSATTPIKWVCTTAGTPGIWLAVYGVAAARQTGWTVSTGTPSRGAFAAAAATAPSAAYVQAEATASATRIAALEARLIALEADSRAFGVIN